MTRRAPVVSSVSRVADGFVFVPSLSAVAGSTRQTPTKRFIR